jgi:hypothetical protein
MEKERVIKELSILKLRQQARFKEFVFQNFTIHSGLRKKYLKVV